MQLSKALKIANKAIEDFLKSVNETGNECNSFEELCNAFLDLLLFSLSNAFKLYSPQKFMTRKGKISSL